MIEADHPPHPTPPGQLPPELTFGRNLIGFTENQQERLQIATAQTTLLELGFDVGKIDGKLGPKTTKAIKAFQKSKHLEMDGKISEQLLEQLKMAVESMPPADTSQPDRASQQ